MLTVLPARSADIAFPMLRGWREGKKGVCGCWRFIPVGEGFSSSEGTGLWVPLVSLWQTASAATLPSRYWDFSQQPVSLYYHAASERRGQVRTHVAVILAECQRFNRFAVSPQYNRCVGHCWRYYYYLMECSVHIYIHNEDGSFNISSPVQFKESRWNLV
jgi:hypothetical protein